MKKKGLLVVLVVTLVSLSFSSCRTGRSAPHCPAYRTQVEVNLNQVNSDLIMEKK